MAAPQTETKAAAASPHQWYGLGGVIEERRRQYRKWEADAKTDASAAVLPRLPDPLSRAIATFLDQRSAFTWGRVSRHAVVHLLVHIRLPEPLELKISDIICGLEERAHFIALLKHVALGPHRYRRLHIVKSSPLGCRPNEQLGALAIVSGEWTEELHVRYPDISGLPREALDACMPHVKKLVVHDSVRDAATPHGWFYEALRASRFSSLTDLDVTAVQAYSAASRMLLMGPRGESKTAQAWAKGLQRLRFHGSEHGHLDCDDTAALLLAVHMPNLTALDVATAFTDFTDLLRNLPKQHRLEHLSIVSTQYWFHLDDPGEVFVDAVAKHAPGLRTIELKAAGIRGKVVHLSCRDLFRVCPTLERLALLGQVGKSCWDTSHITTGVGERFGSRLRSLFVGTRPTKTDHWSWKRTVKELVQLRQDMPLLDDFAASILGSTTVMIQSAVKDLPVLARLWNDDRWTVQTTEPQHHVLDIDFGDDVASLVSPVFHDEEEKENKDDQEDKEMLQLQEQSQALADFCTAIHPLRAPSVMRISANRLLPVFYQTARIAVRGSLRLDVETGASTKLIVALLRRRRGTLHSLRLPDNSLDDLDIAAIIRELPRYGRKDDFLLMATDSKHALTTKAVVDICGAVLSRGTTFRLQLQTSATQTSLVGALQVRLTTGVNLSSDGGTPGCPGIRDAKWDRGFLRLVHW